MGHDRVERIGNDADTSAATSARLEIGGVHDPAELEADRAADIVVARLFLPGASSSPPESSARVERSADPGAATPPRPVPGPPRVLRSAQAAASMNDRGVSVGAEGGWAPPELHAGIERSTGGGEPLDDRTRAGMEHAFGSDLSRTRIHRSATADRLSRSANARAMTVGQDIYFASGEFAPSTPSGARLLAHELAHTVQNAGSSSGVHRSPRIQRKYHHAQVDSNAHLRTEQSWSEKKGHKLTPGRVVLAGDTPKRTNEANKQKKELSVDRHGIHREDVYWRAALVMAPNQLGTPVQDHQAGFIRASSVTDIATNDVVKDHLIGEISQKLRQAEQHSPALAGKLLDVADANHIGQLEHLFAKQLRATTLGGYHPELEAQLLNTMPDRIARIGQGALEMAEMIEHWRKKLHPTKSKRVRIDSVEYTKSDLHARGLGVIRVKFTKPAGGNQTFPETNVDVMLKPEDKSLERELVGADPADPTFESAATQINELLGIDGDPKQALTTMRMSSDALYGTMIERIPATSPVDLDKKMLPFPPVEQTFYETYVFAALAGLDDLHKENVMWAPDGRPYLIDADNVLSQRIYEGNTELAQTGFVSTQKGANAVSQKAFSDAGARAKTATDDDDNSQINSKLLAALNKGDATTRRIIDIMKNAMNGRTCRVVPIKTAQWAIRVEAFGTITARDRSDKLDLWSSPAEMVDTTKEGGAGMRAVVGAHPTNTPVYDRAIERTEMEADLRSGIVPFYEYDFRTGDVSHNGKVVYRGVEAIQVWEAYMKHRFNV